MRELFSIGEMAKLFQTNIRTLRYYDEIGLLKPEWRDDNSGYRYYSTKQVRTNEYHQISACSRYAIGSRCSFLRSKRNRYSKIASQENSKGKFKIAFRNSTALGKKYNAAFIRSMMPSTLPSMKFMRFIFRRAKQQFSDSPFPLKMIWSIPSVSWNAPMIWKD